MLVDERTLTVNFFRFIFMKGRKLTISRKMAKIFYVGRRRHHLTDPSFKSTQVKTLNFWKRLY